MDDPAGRFLTILILHDRCRSRYMAPEIYQVQQYDGRKIDIWSAGVTLLVCLYGEYPWAAPTRIPSEGVFR